LGWALGPAGSFWAQESPKIRVGVVQGPDKTIVEKVKSVAQESGLEVEVVSFLSSRDSLKALGLRQINLSACQHKPMLEDFVQENNVLLIPLGNTYVAPLGFYSQKIKSLSEIESGAQIVIHVDPDKRRRGLVLLQQFGLIKLKDVPWPSKADIVENPLNLVFIEADFIRPFLNNDSITAIAFSAMSEDINSLVPSRFRFRPICLEEAALPYVNVVASRLSGRDNPRYEAFVKAYQSPQIADFVLNHFKGTVMPVFDFE
jgi:D-methionine transport system substrate-binding protein